MPKAQKKTSTSTLSKAVKSLIVLGRRQGFLTQDLVLGKVPEPQKHIEQLDIFYDTLFKAGVAFFGCVFF